jgi:hypothetical protein
MLYFINSLYGRIQKQEQKLMNATAVVFDVQQAKAVFANAKVIENRPGQMEYVRFEIANALKGVRTIVSVNYHGGEVHVCIEVVTADSPSDKNLWDFDTNLISSGDFHYVKGVYYDPSSCDPMITLKLANASDTPSSVTIHRDGRWHFKIA